MSEPLEIRPLTAEDTPAVLDLLKASFGDRGVRWTQEIWSWKHLRNPFGPSPGLLALAGGRPVALRVFLRWAFRRANAKEPIPAVRAVDTVTHPDWRGRGLFSRLTRELIRRVAENGARFVFNTPNSKSRPGYLRMGWQVAGRVPLLVRLRRPWRLPGRGLGNRQAAVPDLADVSPVGDLLAAPDMAWRVEGRSETRLRTDRSIPYLRWRYHEIEAAADLRYRSLWVCRGTSKAALVVRARRRRGLSEIDVAEILMDSSDETGAVGDRACDLATDLLRRLVREADADILVALAAPGTPERVALRRAGFLPARWLAPRLTVLPLTRDHGAQGPSVTDIGACRWSLGDLELF